MTNARETILFEIVCNMDNAMLTSVHMVDCCCTDKTSIFVYCNISNLIIVSVLKPINRDIAD